MAPSGWILVPGVAEVVREDLLVSVLVGRSLESRREVLEGGISAISQDEGEDFSYRIVAHRCHGKSIGL